MNRFYKFCALLILFITILFPASSYSCINNKLRVNLSSQINKAVKIQSKSNVRMSDSIIGIWSGKHISLEADKDGAKIEYDCASGVIKKKIILDGKHRFSILGTYVEEHGGPVRYSDKSSDNQVKYIGQIQGKKMTLIVKRTDNDKIIGTFRLLYGQESTLVKCR